MNTDNRRKVLTIKEAAHLIDGITEFRIRTMCKTGELRSFKAGRKYLIAESDLYEAVLGKAYVPTNNKDNVTLENKDSDRLYRRHSVSVKEFRQRKNILSRTLRSKGKDD